MPILRRLAVRWLEAIVRNAPPPCREWASAMLRELDFIESDWAALLWAFGSTAAISRHWLRAWQASIRGREEEPTMKDTAIKVAGLLLGVLIAVAVMAAGAFAVLGCYSASSPLLNTRVCRGRCGYRACAGGPAGCRHGEVVAKETADGGRDSAGGGGFRNALRGAYCDPLERVIKRTISGPSATLQCKHESAGDRPIALRAQQSL